MHRRCIAYKIRMTTNSNPFIGKNCLSYVMVSVGYQLLSIECLILMVMESVDLERVRSCLLTD